MNKSVIIFSIGAALSLLASTLDSVDFAIELNMVILLICILPFGWFLARRVVSCWDFLSAMCNLADVPSQDLGSKIIIKTCVDAVESWRTLQAVIVGWGASFILVNGMIMIYYDWSMLVMGLNGGLLLYGIAVGVVLNYQLNYLGDYCEECNKKSKKR